jgi:hypothetical protein
MLTTENFGGHVIVEYKRNSKKMPVGVVVATGSGIIGWSLCSQADTFNKAFGLNIALNRAIKIESLPSFMREEFILEKIPNSLIKLYVKVLERSKAYFKKAE